MHPAAASIFVLTLPRHFTLSHSELGLFFIVCIHTKGRFCWSGALSYIDLNVLVANECYGKGARLDA